MQFGDEQMERTVAIRLDGMLGAALASLDAIAHYMKNNLSAEEYSDLVASVGQAMGEVVHISSSLHSRFPDIIPKELIPPSD
jgi:hypothetical protein